MPREHTSWTVETVRVMRSFYFAPKRNAKTVGVMRSFYSAPKIKGHEGNNGYETRVLT